MTQQELIQERLAMLVGLISQISQAHYAANWRCGIEDIIRDDWDNPDYQQVTTLAAHWNLWLKRDNATGKVEPVNLLVLNVGGAR